MKKKTIKAVSTTMAALLVVSGIGYSMLYSKTEVASADTSEAEKKVEKAIKDNVSLGATGEDKEETVYVITDANGKATKTIVSDWLKNKDGSNTIKDKTDLKDVKNVKSNADYKTGSNNEIEWNADGKDIYYQGTTDKALPVDVKVTYLLDGKEMKPDEIAGKSGKVTIRFEYTNNQKQQVNINGKAVDLYTPFVMISGMVLPTDQFSNVEVTSGKVISEGNNQVVVGLAFPGVNENLNLASVLPNSDLQIPGSVEVTAQVENFSLLTTLTMGSANLLGKVNTDNIASTNDLKAAVTKIIESTNQLQSGAAQLKDGLGELLKNMDPYGAGMNQLSNGLYDINAGVGLLNQKMSEFVAGLNTALDGTKTLSQTVNDQILPGAQGVANGATLAANGVSQISAAFNNTTDANGNTVYGLTDGSAAVDQGVAQLQSKLNGMVTSIQSSIAANNEKANAITAVLQGGISPTTGAALTAEEVAGYTANLQQLGGANAALQTMLNQMDPATMSAEISQLKDGTANLASGVGRLQAGVNEYQGKVGELAAGANQLSAGIALLNEKVQKELQPGMQQLYDGGVLMQSSVGTLYAGTQKASAGMSELITNTGKIKTAISQLSAGSTTLSDGITQFKTQAIDKVSASLTGNLEDTVERLKATMTLSQSYNIYSMAADGKDSSVKFIYKTAEIKAK